MQTRLSLKDLAPSAPLMSPDLTVMETTLDLSVYDLTKPTEEGKASSKAGKKSLTTEPTERKTRTINASYPSQPKTPVSEKPVERLFLSSSSTLPPSETPCYDKKTRECSIYTPDYNYEPHFVGDKTKTIAEIVFGRDEKGKITGNKTLLQAFVSILRKYDESLKEYNKIDHKNLWKSSTTAEKTALIAYMTPEIYEREKRLGKLNFYARSSGKNYEYGERENITELFDQALKIMEKNAAGLYNELVNTARDVRSRGPSSSIEPKEATKINQAITQAHNTNIHFTP